MRREILPGLLLANQVNEKEYLAWFGLNLSNGSLTTQ